MIKFTSGNLLDSKAEALVNTVNTVGVMGKGIALMFKEAFPENYERYEAACARKEVQLGRMYVTERRDLLGGPKWVINFPTKAHWRFPSQLSWIEDGLDDLQKVIRENGIRSVAVPPLGSGNGGLPWGEVRRIIVDKLGRMEGVDVIVYEPTSKYQNVAKREGVETLTPARALITESIRRYASIGFECTLLEVQKLAYFLEKTIVKSCGDNPLRLEFKANKFGPYAPKLGHLLNQLDGSYLHSSKRLADATPLDVIWIDRDREQKLALYLATEAKTYLSALDETTALIDGFESPLGMELLATVDWLLVEVGADRTIESIKRGLRDWPGGAPAGARKLRLFEDRMIGTALERLN